MTSQKALQRLTPDDEGVVRITDEFPPPYHRPTPKQVEFWKVSGRPEIDEVLFDGAIRSGKTQAACKLITAWAWEHGGPNWRFVIMRRTYRELEDSTKAAFLRGDGKMPPACPPGLIANYIKSDEKAILLNGAEILFRSAENPAETEDKLRNVTLAGVFIDQVEELDGDAYFQMYETLVSRCSDDRGPRKLLLVANPGPEDHWVHRRFVDDFTKEEWCGRVHVTLWDNEYNLHPSYIRSMKRRSKTNPMWYKRFIEGEWGAFGGKRFPVWDEKIHVCDPFPVPTGWEIVTGIDYGWSNPTAAVYCAIDYEGRWWVCAEHAEREKPISWHAMHMKRLEDSLQISPSSRWLDPSAWATRSEYHSPALELSEYGIDAGRAQNDRLGGWNRIEEMLSKRMADGMPQLRIFSTCRELIKELPNARIKDGTDDIEKENDHSLDALRYAIMSRMPHPELDEEEEDLSIRDAYARQVYERATKEPELADLWSPS